MLHIGDTIGLVACSNGLSISQTDNINNLINTLNNLGLKVKLSPFIFAKNSIFNGSPKEKAEALENMFLDSTVKIIFDISGGDLCNEILEYLNLDLIKDNPKVFCGYSDVSVLLNTLYSKCNITTYYYQIRNIISEYRDSQINDFKDFFFNNNNSLLNFSKEWIQGNSMEGIVVGGNLRCTLKLAGTPYLPDFKNKILFLESLGGDIGRIYTSLVQYKNIGAFDNLNGIILGNFTEMEKNNYNPTVVELLLKVLGSTTLPIIKSNNLGHGKDSKSIPIGFNFKI